MLIFDHGLNTSKYLLNKIITITYFIEYDFITMIKTNIDKIIRISSLWVNIQNKTPTIEKLLRIKPFGSWKKLLFDCKSI